MGWKLQAAEHVDALPVRVSVVHAMPSLHSVGQLLPSQVSPASTTLLPQKPPQSLSVAEVQPEGQQPSPLLHMVMGSKVQAALHIIALPVRVSVVQALPSLHTVGQLAPSQVSPASTTPLPHIAMQSLSLLLVHDEGQHPSSLAQAEMGLLMQTALHVAALPVSVSVVH